eukprot:gnl/TRDRNA2_/TRDRNA2_78536_c1_seq2.p1 gnl/TRDRNA2_/TRDRNA2_78536_c1~~gnl/TRDRNA2_/TRDRNA2_78536_c1_seq2.p1  ORF type:complete len:267 (-),score=56.34 gnl/TRDRNA2_/TRDRNA2_78536_c1_seq2:93-851(-)
MVKREGQCFKGLTILKATSQRNGCAPTLVGYMMFQTGEEKTCKRGRKRCRHRHWVQVKQLFVQRRFRSMGAGRLLLAEMMKKLSNEERDDIRLSVLELNKAAVQWYRAQGFLIMGVSRELIGCREDANVLVYQEMHRIGGERLEELEGTIPTIFKTEIINEVLTIRYPDGSGDYVVKVTDYHEQARLHHVDSAGYSLWDDDSFVDTVDINEFHRDGHITFHRHLSYIFREVELEKRAVRRAKADARAIAKLA